MRGLHTLGAPARHLGDEPRAAIHRRDAETLEFVEDLGVKRD